MTVNELIQLLQALAFEGRGDCLVEVLNGAGELTYADEVKVGRVFYGPRKDTEVVRIY